MLNRANEARGGFNGIVSLDFPSLSGILSAPFAKIVDGESEGDIYLTPGYAAAKNIKLQARVPGVTAVV